jgi:4-hydroxybenzoate polyprenyltransferase
MVLLKKIYNLGQLIRFSHTIFALPFALASMWLAAGGWPQSSVVVWILVCMVMARTSAMAFNRVVDWEIDKRNPRTENRHKLVPKPAAIILVVLSAMVFELACMQLNTLCIILSPVALILVFLYSLTKRFTSYSHVFLGLALSAAPIGAWIAVRGDGLDMAPWILGVIVMTWVCGFDLIYALMDEEFDRSQGLHSFPAKHGKEKTLKFALSLHLIALLLLLVLGFVEKLKTPYGYCWVGMAFCIFVEHRLARTGRVDLINKAFFQMNACVSLLLLIGVIFGLR